MKQNKIELIICAITIVLLVTTMVIVNHGYKNEIEQYEDYSEYILRQQDTLLKQQFSRKTLLDSTRNNLNDLSQNIKELNDLLKKRNNEEVYYSTYGYLEIQDEEDTAIVTDSAFIGTLYYDCQ